MRKGIGGRPRTHENLLSRWIDEHFADETSDLTARERFAAEAGIVVSGLGHICRGQFRPGMELAARIEEITSGVVPLQYWVRSVK